MPRLDPFQLLKTVSVLLSPDGGIKSEHEVLRLVQLMQKFSKKIVSKTIYVEILKVTCQPLLQQFLKLEGWELLNLWFLECIKTHNWPLCVEIMTLFLVCPVTADLLKLNADVNQGPRLINQIRLNESLDDNVRGLANSVYEKWYGVLSPKQATAPVKVTIKVPSGKVVSKPLMEASNNGASKSSTSDKEKKLRSPDDKRLNDKDKERLKAKEREREKYRDKDRDRKRKDEPLLNSSIDKERKRFRPDRRDEVNAEEKQRIKEKARLLKEEAQAKKDKETLSKVTGGSSSTGLSKIPKIPKKVLPLTDDKPKPMSFEALLGGLDSKPKTVKTPMVKNKTAALLESFSKPSSGTSKSHHHHHHHSSKKDGHSSRHEKDSKKDSSSKSHGDKKPQVPVNKFPKISIPKRTSGDLESPKSKSGSFAESPSFMDAILNSMTTSEEPRKKKRKLSGSAEKSTPEAKGESSPEVKKEDGEKPMEASPEPKLEKKEPTFSFYRDTLEDPEEERPIEARRATRRPLKIDSDSDEDNGKKEDGDSGQSKDSTPSPKTEEDSQTSNETDVKEESRDSQSGPGQPKSILVVSDIGRRKKQSIRFREGPNLVEVRYFELDESERVNVNKIKFENMRKIDMDSENAAMKSKKAAGCEEIFWYKPRLVAVTNRQPFVPGHNSREKDVQLNRETTVLAAFLLNKESIPDTPSEPDAPIVPMFIEKTKVIPLIDLEADNSGQSFADFSVAGWPEPKENDVDQPEPNISNLLSSIDVTGLQPPPFQKPPPGLSQEEQNMLMAQKEAMLKLGISVPGYQPTRVPPPGIPEIPPPFASRFRPPPVVENNKHESPEFNEGPVGDPGFDGPPEQFGGPGFNGNPDNFPPRFNGPPDQFGPRFNGPPGFNGHPDGFVQPPGFNGPPFVRGNMRPNFNNFGPPRGGRGGFNPGFRGGRGPPGPMPMRGPPPEFFHRRGNMSARPCKFFTQRGFCRDGDQCKFLHEQ